MADQNLSISRAVKSDVERILYIERLSFSQNGFSARAIKYHIQKNLTLVARLDSLVCGYLVLSPLTKTKQRRVYSIAVDPEYRGMRVGVALMKSAEKMSKARSIILEVDETNDSARKLYEKIGFEIFGRYDKYYGSTDALRMKKIIKK